jgi:hypothetical protein
MASPLEDLDELILRCRDDRAKVYIAEAVASYRAGAFRSAIVAAWIAVCFDVIEKLRELALAGDSEAEKQVQDLETTRRTNDVSRALKFERDLLDVAQHKFELLSPLERIDLERLQEDRNRCAHPSLTSDDQAYTPSAELARLHIHSAVTHLLQHPPVQGKFALDRLIAEIESEYFPTNAAAAKVAFASGPLRRPRESLVRNLTLVLAKALLREAPKYKRRMRLSAALSAISALQPAIYSKVMAERASSLVRTVEDTKLLGAVKAFPFVYDIWSFLDGDVRQRFESYITNLPGSDFDEIDVFLEYAPLRKAALGRVRRATKKDLKEALFFTPPKEVIDRFLEIYLASTTFDDANEWAKDMMPHTNDFPPDAVKKLIQNAGSNSQLTGSFQLGPLLSTLRGTKIIPVDEFNELLRTNELGGYAPSVEDF